MADTFDVIMAAYPSVGLARQDFDGLVQLVKDKRVRTEGVILVEHDEDGEVRVTETGDHLGARDLAGAAGWVPWSACSRRRCSPRSWSGRRPAAWRARSPGTV